VSVRPGAGQAPEVLVVDDSAIAREVLRAILSRAGFQVHTAPSAEIALRRVSERPISVLILDLRLPGASGLELMAALPRPRPPIVICSALAATDAALALAALEAGALDIIGKPELGVSEYLEASAERIVNAVRLAARAPGSALPESAPPPAPAPRPAPLPVPAAGIAPIQVIAIGASAGGVEALHHLLPALPLGLPPILVVQHMPAAFCPAFARRLDECCALDVHLAEDGEQLARGQVLIAPGGKQLSVTRVGQRLLCRSQRGEPVKRHAPSVNVLFSSLVRSAGKSCLAVLLTGMGDDGVDGMLELRQAGALTIAQDERSSTVFGMPREAARRGAASEVLPLQRIAARLEQLSAR
jgi:two-component system chemotaxis response regulator CheB